MGAAFATLLSFVLRFGLFYYWSQKLWPVSYQWGPHSKLVLWGTSAVILNIVIAPTILIGQLALSTTLFLLFLTLAWYRIVSAEDRHLISRSILAPRQTLASLISRDDPRSL